MTIVFSRRIDQGQVLRTPGFQQSFINQAVRGVYIYANIYARFYARMINEGQCV